VPAWLRRSPLVSCTGRVPRSQVIERLHRSRFYISSTYAENSFNGAAEGIFLAAESFISDIPPHRELLAHEDVQVASFPGVARPMLPVRRERLRGLHLKSWHSLVSEMLTRVEHELAGAGARTDLGRHTLTGVRNYGAAGS